MTFDYFAHSENANGSGVRETVRDHLRAVERLARDFAAAFQMAERARAAALLHDLGKYSQQFQDRICKPGTPSRDHWSVGAVLAASAYLKQDLGIAACILGHHVGLSEMLCPTKWNQLGESIEQDVRQETFTSHDFKAMCELWQRDGFSLPGIKSECTSNPTGRLAADKLLDVRMLFSALVDADYLATEAHFHGDAACLTRPRPAGPPLDIERALAAFTDYIAQFRAGKSSSPMDGVRDSLANACRAAAERGTGPMTLSAPTGSGKTLAMLAFTLLHAQKHGLRRIVVVLPFLNIIEQTARIYREIFSTERGFSADFILEDHSLKEEPALDSTNPDEQRLAQFSRQLAENWDAPVIVTTNVQLLESLHSNRPARCRKLHRLAQSVILFDEVQTLPPKLAKLTLGTLSRLSDPAGPYKSTVVFATATQPAFSSLHSQVVELSQAGWQPREIVEDSAALFTQASGRVRVSWRHKDQTSLDQLADELAQQPRVLCIVNLKRHATELAQQLQERTPEPVLHLSTNLCIAHRQRVLDTIRAALADPQQPPVRVIATQCVEAGVDLSFPTVYRALAPLESIAQAAGRCNRHHEQSSGEVVVFSWPAEPGKIPYPQGYSQAAQATANFLKVQLNGNPPPEILHSPERIQQYYTDLYVLTGRSQEIAADEQQIAQAMKDKDFAGVADHYRLIDNNTINLLVPYDDQRDVYLRLLQAAESGLRANGMSAREWLRQARPIAVSVFRPRDDSPLRNHLKPIPLYRDQPDAEATWFRPLAALDYHHTLGLVIPNDLDGALIG